MDMEPQGKIRDHRFSKWTFRVQASAHFIVLRAPCVLGKERTVELGAWSLGSSVLLGDVCETSLIGRKMKL